MENKNCKSGFATLIGRPNVGKSTFINKVARRKTAKAEDRPGVTRSKQWVPVDSTLELLDTPGILWPKFDDPGVGKRLAFTGAIKDDVLRISNASFYVGKGEYELFVVNGNQLIKRKVQLGDSNFEYVEVVNGLEPGDEVVVSDMTSFKEKNKLKLK